MITVQKKKQRLPQWLKKALLLEAIIVSFGVAVLAFLTLDAFAQYLTNTPLNPAAGNGLFERGLSPIIATLPDPHVEIVQSIIQQEETITQELADIAPNAVALPVLTSTDRLTVLVMGADRRPGESVYSRTDTMILLSIDPQSETASMMSIPRDLWVEIPNYNRNYRINTAFVLGSQTGGTQGGAELAMETITHNLGIKIDHYILVDFQTVTNLIDELGGVTIDVPETIDDPLYPDMSFGYDPFYIEAGNQKLDGSTSLKYMRTRHTGTDFDRSRRQQQVIVALRDQLSDQGIPRLLLNLPAFIQEARDGIYTDMSITGLQTLANTARTIESENIERGVLDYNYVTSYQTNAGASVLLLQPEPAQALISSLFE